MDLKKRRTIRAIRRLAVATPSSQVDERLKMITELATGKIDPSDVRNKPDGNALANRVRKSQGKEEVEPERKKRGGHDRKARSGSDRGEE